MACGLLARTESVARWLLRACEAGWQSPAAKPSAVPKSGALNAKRVPSYFKQ